MAWSILKLIVCRRQRCFHCSLSLPRQPTLKLWLLLVYRNFVCACLYLNCLVACLVVTAMVLHFTALDRYFTDTPAITQYDNKQALGPNVVSLKLFINVKGSMNNVEYLMKRLLKSSHLDYIFFFRSF